MRHRRTLHWNQRHCVRRCLPRRLHSPKKNKSFEDERPSLDEVTQLTPWNALTAAPVCRSALFRRFLRWMTSGEVEAVRRYKRSYGKAARLDP